MPRPKREGVEAVGLRLHEEATHKLKIVAAQRRTTFSSLVQEALALWWAQQPEASTEGPLFPGGASPVVATSLPASPAAKEKP